MPPQPLHAHSRQATTSSNLLDTAKSQLLLRLTTAFLSTRTTAHSSVSKTLYKLRFLAMNKSRLDAHVRDACDLVLGPKTLSLEKGQGQACKIVFDTTELLALNFAHLPAKTILRVMRVSSTFKNCLQTAPGVLDKLWFRERRFRMLKAPPGATRTLLDPRFFSETNAKTRLMPVFLDPYLCWDRTNVEDIRLALPFVDSQHRENGWLPVAELLHVDHPQCCPGLILDTHFTYPVYNSTIVHLDVWLKKVNGELWGRFKLPPRAVFGSDASTPRSALVSLLRSVQQVHLWRDGIIDDKVTPCLNNVDWVVLQEFIEGTEKRHNVKTVIDVNTTFELANAQIPAAVG